MCPLQRLFYVGPCWKFHTVKHMANEGQIGVFPTRLALNTEIRFSPETKKSI